MNILIIGSGGREHALAWKMTQSKKPVRVFVAPGNAGTASSATNIKIDISDFSAVKKAVSEYSIDMVVVGPEAPLVDGIVDFFSNDSVLKDIPVIGPLKSAARLEGSKDFAKAFMTRHNIPTARYKSFDSSQLESALLYLRTMEPPYVIKADGLAAGKGVLIVDYLMEAEREVEDMLGGAFGDAGKTVVLEECLRGIELSVFIITDGNSWVLLPEAKDYKRIGEGDSGLNTGGMGAISPVPFADRIFMEKVTKRIIEPTVQGLKDDGIVYKGFIFFGLMKVKGEPYVIEYNARLGDPETEAIMPRIKSDLVDLLEGVAHGDLASRTIEIDSDYCTAVMMVSGGYPGPFRKGKVIEGLDRVDNCFVFHAGTTLAEGKVISSGGRVLAVSSTGITLKEALDKSYKSIKELSFEDSAYRKDIGFDLTAV